ncbi:hypothetical protein AMJ85_08870 [candidate division BRC1 bacterium SM23_51]|nr:MAG: hypothetical protein AMJ85_08870 [candidate division BRC1 bacterium SM23_51]
MKQIGKEELERGSGAEGKRSLVAVGGKVYDVTSSKLWRNGLHVKTHKAGRDLSLAIKAAPHGTEVLDRFEQVGVLAEEEAAEEEKVAKPPLLVEKLLEQHPHPISVHFPIALSIVAALFMALFLVLRKDSFETFTLYCIVLATLAAPVSISTGLLSWIYNYSRVWTRIYRVKTALSIVLVILQISALVIRLVIVSGPDLSSPVYWVYAVLALAMAPTVMALGYFGGKITFPS